MTWEHPIMTYIINNVNKEKYSALMQDAIYGNPNTSIKTEIALGCRKLFLLADRGCFELMKWHGIARNPNLTLDMIEATPEYDWKWGVISSNHNISVESILDHTVESILNIGKFNNWEYISYNPNLKWDIIKKNLHRNLDWSGISANPNITWDIIEKNPSLSWDWYELSKHPNITWEIIKNNPDKPWDWSAFAENPNMTWDIIKNNPSNLWNWSCITQSSYITWDIIKENPEYPWCWSCMLYNPNLTWDIIINNYDSRWDWYYINLNPNITLEIIESNMDKNWSWNAMAENMFAYHPHFVSPAYKKKLVKKFMENCFRELIEKTCTVERKLNWDEDFMEDCQSELYIGGRDFYLAECKKYEMLDDKLIKKHI
jgi:hypothetical protein